jgi:hypothetical protein
MSARNSRTTTAPPVSRGTGPAAGTGRGPVEPPTGERPGAEPQPARHRRTPVLWFAVTVAIVVAVLLVATFAGGTVTSEDATPSGGTSETGIEPTVGSQEYLNRLANQGYIPPEAVDRERLFFERLVGRGDIPPGSLE